MRKYKIEIEFDLDLQPIFDKIPDGLFAKPGPGKASGSDVYYEVQMIDKCFRNALFYALDKDMTDMAKKDGLYPYKEHHNKCEIEVAQKIIENLKITVGGKDTL